MYLPRPEEPILQCIHASQGKLLYACLEIIIPVRGILPLRTIHIRGLLVSAQQEQPTIVEPGAEFPRYSYPERQLTIKVSGQYSRNSLIDWMRVYLSFIDCAQLEHALPGQTPPLPLIGEVSEAPSNAK
jgi:hypothetical protein